MKLFIKAIAGLLAMATIQAAAITLDQAQAMIDKLQPGGKATEIREYYRQGNRVHEIEYQWNDEEYEAIFLPDGTLLENYKDTGATGLPLIASLALSQDSALYKDQSQSADVIPVIIGNYGNFWFKGLRHGYSLYSRDAFTFSPMIKINPDRGYQVGDADNHSNLYLGLEDTEPTLEAGTQFLFDFSALQLELNLLADISGGHKGTLAELAIAKPQNFGSLLLKPALTFTYSDKKVSNYYFGVAEQLATGFRPAFTAGNSLDTELSLILIWNISQRWYMVGNLGYTFYDDKLKDSPLLDSNRQSSGFIGIGYGF